MDGEGGEEEEIKGCVLWKSPPGMGEDGEIGFGKAQ